MSDKHPLEQRLGLCEKLINRNDYGDHSGYIGALLAFNRELLGIVRVLVADKIKAEQERQRPARPQFTSLMVDEPGGDGLTKDDVCGCGHGSINTCPCEHKKMVDEIKSVFGLGPDLESLPNPFDPKHKQTKRDDLS